METNFNKLKNCPILYHAYTCCKCKKNFSFLSGFRCSCENKKYKNKPVIVNGVKFDGMREAYFCNQLSFLQHKKIINDLEFHPKWKIEHNKTKICDYSADAKFYFDKLLYVIDVKGKETQVFRLKKKLMKAFYPDIDIILIK